MSHETIASSCRRAAAVLLRGLAGDRKRAVTLPFTPEHLSQWTYLPHPHPGLVMGDMDRSERVCVHRLIATVLSEPAHAQVAAIMATEDILDRRDGHRGDRHSTDFWFVVFGSPEDPVWAWRLEGHHICVHVTVTAARVRVAPIFLGCHPALIRHVGAELMAPLGLEERLARELLLGLPPGQTAAAHVSFAPPPDIYTKHAGRVERASVSELPRGVSLDTLDASTRSVAARLLELYAGRLNEPLGSELLADLSADSLSLAWEGSTEPGAPHYYRLIGERFVFEHDNVANGANHVHNVMRRLEGDLDAPDLLALHKEQLHADQSQGHPR